MRSRFQQDGTGNGRGTILDLASSSEVIQSAADHMGRWRVVGLQVAFKEPYARFPGTWGVELGLVNSRPARVSYAVGTHLSFRTQHA